MININEILKNKITVLDGAIGTILAHYLSTGQLGETLNLTSPDKILAMHENYIKAGSEFIYTNTFNASRYKFEDRNKLSEIIINGVQIAKQAAKGKNVLVGLDVGPLGALLEPLGSLTFNEAYESYLEIINIGAKAGADIVAVETMSDLLECKAAVLAARDVGLPVFATMSFDSKGMTFTGCSAESMAVTLTALGASAVGLNCSLGPDKMIPIAERILNNTHLPVIVKANAGLPNLGGGYDVTPEEFKKHYKTLTDMGVSVIGGCCGTTPEHIAGLSKLKNNYHAQKREYTPAVSSHSQTVKLDRLRVIGERINPTGKKLMQQALINSDYDYVLEQALSQTAAGAEILDVNCGMNGIDETKVLSEMVLKIQSVSDTPLQIDSASPEAIESALKVYRGRAIVNSVNADDKVLNKVLPLVKRYGALVIGLTLNESGIPSTAKARLDFAAHIINRAKEYGICEQDIIIDPLTLTLGAEQAQANETLKAVRELTNKGIKTVLGVSNISFGLPEREVINRTFLTAALSNGLSLAIINPNSQAMNETIAAFRVINGDDTGAKQYSLKNTGEKIEPGKTAASVEIPATIEKCILSGLKDECANLIKRKIEEDKIPPLDLIDELIKALDIVGQNYETGKLFLPGLLMSAEAARSGFEVIRSQIKQGGINKGKIILATVRGDIHDIGKNIVKVILANYGYEIIDLGKNVDFETIIARAKKENISLIGLSALMTTTVKSMEEIIKNIRLSGHNCKIMVGGAVLTEEYSKKIGADFYAKDANAAIKIAKIVFE